MELAIVDRVVGIMYDLGGADFKTCEKRFSRVRDAIESAGFDICDLKPLAKLLGCEPEMDSIKEAAHSLLGSRGSARHHRIYAAIAQALNWDRTEYDTLDELLEELRASEDVHNEFVDAAIEQNELMETVREKLCLLAETLGSTPLLDEAIELMEPHHYDDGAATTHTLLHAGELYREVTILLRTEQLVAWRTVDGQEYSAPAHQVLLDPDEDGLAAAILSRIAGVEIAPEHMAELRAQMAGGVTRG